MKKFFHAHPNSAITVLALVFLGIIAALYLWVINDIIVESHRALTSSPAQNGASFDLLGASQLDLHGVLNTSTPAVTSATAATSTAAPATTTSVTTTAASSLDDTFNATNTDSIAQQLSGITQAIPDDDPNVVPVTFSNLQFTSTTQSITVDVSAADKNTASAFNNALEHSSHFNDVQSSGESTASSGRIMYSITFVYVP